MRRIVEVKRSVARKVDKRFNSWIKIDLNEQ